LTTDKSVYQVGEPIRVTFTETNTGQEPAQIGVDAGDGLTVMQDGAVVWDQNQGRLFPLCTVSETLQPGQSRTWTGTWDGIPNTVPPSILSGSFTVYTSHFNRIDMQGPSATFQIASPPAAKLTSSLTTDHSLYVLGQQPINMTFTETNTGDQPTAIIVGGSFDAMQNGNEIWNSSSPGFVLAVDPPFGVPLGQDLHWETLQPGQSYTQTATWNGLPQGVPAVATGTFVVSNEVAPRRPRRFSSSTPSLTA
jgi:hypothetical protein